VAVTRCGIGVGAIAAENSAHKLSKFTKVAENNFPGTQQMALQKLKKLQTSYLNN